MNLELGNLENTLIICLNNYKNSLLEMFSNEHKIFGVNFMTLEEYKKNFYFNYDFEAVKYLVDKGLSQDNAKEILNNICYVENKTYNNNRLDKLVAYKNELQSNNLLIYNPIFKEYVKNKNVIVIGYQQLNKNDESIIIGKTVKIVIDKEIEKKYTINSFVDINNEVEFIYNSIYDLLEKGIDINDIYVMNLNSDYDSYIKKYNKYYGFNIEETNNNLIIGTELAKKFVEMLDNNTKEEIYDYLKEKNNDVSNKLIKILNNYADVKLEDAKKYILSDLNNARINKLYKNVVKKAEIGTFFDKNEYVFLLGFNDEVPSTSKDTDYISDNLKPLVNLQNSEAINSLRKSNLRIYLSNIDNLVLSYCESSPFKTYNKQILFDEEKSEYKYQELKNNYSDNLNKERLINKLDNLRKFNDVSNTLDKLYATYGKNNYLNYNNKFKGLTSLQTQNLINQISNDSKLKLSYSSMNSFFECNFKYYLENVLKVKEPFGTYYTKLGTVCHGVLQDLYREENFDFEESWNKQITKEEEKENTKIFENSSEMFFVNKIKEELKQDIDIVRKQKANSLLSNEKCEEIFTHDVTENIKFVGFIDKLMYKQTDDEILASVVDYKTSKSIEIDKDIMKFGLSLQLPSYLYLIKHSSTFDKNVRIVGLYIQHIINYDNKYRDINTQLTQNKEESMKLDGISSIDPDRLSMLDISLNSSSKSETIKGISINKDGSLKKSTKLYSDEQFDDLSNLVEENIKIAGNTIISGDFSINPKQIDKVNKSCEYCKYAAICYRRNDDIKHYSTKEEQ